MTEMYDPLTARDLACTPDELYNLRLDGFTIIDGVKKGEPFGIVESAPLEEGWEASKVLLAQGNKWDHKIISLEYDRFHTLYIDYVVYRPTHAGSETLVQKLVLEASRALEDSRKHEYEKTVRGSRLARVLLQPPETAQYWQHNLRSLANARGSALPGRQRFLSRRRADPIN